MFRIRSIGRTARFVVLLTSCYCFVVGCGGEVSVEPGARVYTSPEEIKAKNKELKNAMQGGAYGSAGKAAAGRMGD